MSISREDIASKAIEIASEYYGDNSSLSDGSLSSDILAGKTVTATLLRCELITSGLTGELIWEDTGEPANEESPKMHLVNEHDDELEYTMISGGNIFYSSTGIPEEQRIMETTPMAVNGLNIQGDPPTYWTNTPEYEYFTTVSYVVKEDLSETDWQMLVDNGKIPPEYEHTVHDKDIHGDPKESDEEAATTSVSLTVSEKGEWYSDDHKDAVIAAAVYELLKDQITDLTARVESLEG